LLHLILVPSRSVLVPSHSILSFPSHLCPIPSHSTVIYPSTYMVSDSGPRSVLGIGVPKRNQTCCPSGFWSKERGLRCDSDLSLAS
jgi:hypothetical protein